MEQMNVLFSALLYELDSLRKIILNWKSRWYNFPNSAAWMFLKNDCIVLYCIQHGEKNMADSGFYTFI